MRRYRRVKWKQLHFIGEGVRRKVYDLGNGYVLKQAKSVSGIKSNKREISMYRRSPRRLKRYLGQIRGFGPGYRWLVMKKYGRVIPASLRYQSRLHRLRRRFLRNGILPYEMISRVTRKPNAQNLRLNDSGRVIVIDYGNFVKKRKGKAR
jgi:hypothetical protein